MKKSKILITSLISIVAITFSTIGTAAGDTPPNYVYLPMISNLQLKNPPTAVNDSFSTTQETQLYVPAPGVLENDIDPDGDTLTAVRVSDPTHGNLTLYDDGSFIYTPDPSFTGSDNFTYKASDGELDSNIVTVTINIGEVNDAPVAVADAYSVTEDTPLNVAAPGVLGNDTDVEGNTLTAILVTDVSHGALTLNPNGSFSYIPAASYNGSDSFTYKANDGGLDSNIVTVTLTIKSVSPSCSSPPTLISPGNASVPNTLIPTFQWDNGNVSEVTEIKFLLLLHEDDFPDTWVWWITSYNWISEYSYNSQNLEPGTTYYWKVWQVCGETEGPHSEMWSFTTGTDGTIPAAPNLIAPANGSEIWSGDLPVILQWEEAIGAEQYYLEIYKWSGGTWYSNWARHVSGTQYTIPFTLTQITYYKWNVTSISDYALGDGSPFWQFHTNY